MKALRKYPAVNSEQQGIKGYDGNFLVVREARPTPTPERRSCGALF